MAATNHLERGGKKFALIRDLATAEHSQSFLAMKYGCSQPAISLFGERHRAEIEAHREKIDDAYAGLYLAEKAARIGAYQAEIDEIDAMESPDAAMRKVRQAAVKAIAEELGSLPSRMTVEVKGSKVEYTVKGEVDMGNLA